MHRPPRFSLPCPTPRPAVARPLVSKYSNPVRVESIERMDWEKSRAFLALCGRRRGVRLWGKSLPPRRVPSRQFRITKIINFFKKNKHFLFYLYCVFGSPPFVIKLCIAASRWVSQ